MKARHYFIATMLVAAATVSLPSFAENEVAVSAKVPVFPGWYNGRPVVYLATEASDKDVAKSFGANHVPQLANAARSVPKSVDDIYVVTNFTQATSSHLLPTRLGPKTPMPLTRRFGRSRS